MPVHRVNPDESIERLDPRPICPRCDRPVGDRLTPGERLCTPLSCDAWSVAAVWDRQRRRWVREIDEWQHEHEGKVMVANVERWTWPDGAVTVGALLRAHESCEGIGCPACAGTGTTTEPGCDSP